MEPGPALWLLLAVVAWWIGAAAAGVRRELIELERRPEAADYGFVSLLQRLKHDPITLGLKLRWSRFLAASCVPFGLAMCVGSLSLRWGLVAGLLGWVAAASADAAGGGGLLRRACRARSGSGYAAWARVTQPAARLAHPILALRNRRVKASNEPHNLYAESQAALTPAGGRLGHEERRFLRRLLASAAMRVEAIMTPWDRVHGLASDLLPGQACPLLRASGHSRQPVIDAGRIVGLVTGKDLLLARQNTPTLPLGDLVRPVHYVRHDATASEVLEEFQALRVHLGIVVDRLGRPVGVVTIEDMLEEIVGELYDERERHGGHGS